MFCHSFFFNLCPSCVFLLSLPLSFIFSPQFFVIYLSFVLRFPLSFVLCLWSCLYPRSSILCSLSSVFCPQSSVLCPLLFVLLGPLSFVFLHHLFSVLCPALSFLVSPQLFVICFLRFLFSNLDHRSSVLYPLSTVLRSPLPLVFCPQFLVLCPLSSLLNSLSSVLCAQYCVSVLYPLFSYVPLLCPEYLIVHLLSSFSLFPVGDFIRQWLI